MKLYHSNNIGNVAVLGHLASGKTSVIEAMAKRAGITSQLGNIQSGTTLSDYDEDEILSLGMNIESCHFTITPSLMTLSILRTFEISSNGFSSRQTKSACLPTSKVP